MALAPTQEDAGVQAAALPVSEDIRLLLERAKQEFKYAELETREGEQEPFKVGEECDSSYLHGVEDHSVGLNGIAPASMCWERKLPHKQPCTLTLRSDRRGCGRLY